MKYWHLTIDINLANKIIDGKLKKVDVDKKLLSKINSGDKIILHLKDFNLICNCTGKVKDDIKIEYIRTQCKWQVNISEPWFTFINNDKKTVEGRLNKGKFSKIKKGDIVFFRNKLGVIMTIVLDVKKYKTFQEYLKNEGLSGR